MEQIINQDIDHKPFIEANTIPMSLEEIKEDHIIPVFTKDNTPLISQYELIELFSEEIINMGKDPSQPEIRVSHPIKGRIPAARNKKAAELLPHEKTLYYQRMMFIMRLNLRDSLNGNEVQVIAGGIKAYNQDKLHANKDTQQYFKLFIGLQVKVCCNLCVWTDGAALNVKANSLYELRNQMKGLISGYDPFLQIEAMERLNEYALDEDQFAYFLGRCRLYHQMPYKQQKKLPELLMSDTQLSSVANSYYADEHFKQDNGYIDLWSLYNLFTSANKSSYIDKALERNTNAGKMVSELKGALEGNDFWYLKHAI
jgi:hypothetical protein